MNYYNLLMTIFCGLMVTPIMNGIGMLNGLEGIDYYAEVHQTKWNSVVHTIGMPFTFYGISCWFPALFRLTNRNKNRMQLFCWSLFAIHYMSIDFFRGIFCILFYIYPSFLAYNRTKYTITDKNLFIHGFLVATTSLIFQEYVGHYLGGDDPSRLEGVPNAVAYATYYSTYHLF